MQRLSAWTCVFLASLLTGCGETVTLTKTEYRYVYLPDAFLVDCPDSDDQVLLTEDYLPTFRETGTLSRLRKADRDRCTERLRSAREYQAQQRAKEFVTP